MFLITHADYVIVSEVFHDRTMFLAHLRVLVRRPRSFSRPDRVCRNPRVLLRRLRGFSGPDDV